MNDLLWLERVALLGTIASVGAALAALAARRSSAAVRRAIWGGALACLVVLPVWLALGVRPLAVPVSAGSAALTRPFIADFSPRPQLLPPFAAGSFPEATAPAVAVPAARAAHRALDPWLALFALGALLSIVRLVRDAIALRRFLRRAQPLDASALELDAGLRAAVSSVALVEHPDAHVPATAGFFRARIVLPSGFLRTLAPHELECVLWHELAHARRRDGLMMTLGRIAAALHWFNPLAWFALARFRSECEHAADDFALEGGVSPTVFARTLLAIAERVRSERVLAGTMPMTTRSRVRERVTNMLAPRKTPRFPRALPAVSALAVMCFGLGFGCVSLTPRAHRTDSGHVLAELTRRLPSRIAGFLPAKAAGGLVVGVIRGKNERVYAFGHRAPGDPRAPDRDTVFHVGSLTELFTGLAFAEMIEDRSVRPDDPVERYLPSGVRVPLRSGRPVTLLELATHTSGLPALPTNFVEQDRRTSKRSYTPQMLYDYLDQAVTTPREQKQVVYSYLGVGLLGRALSLREHTNYRDLVRRRVLDPLGLRSTDFFGSSHRFAARLAVGHEPDGRAVPHRTDNPVLGACCAIRTSMTDLLAYARATLDPDSTPFPAAIRLMQKPYAAILPGVRTGIGWDHMSDGALLVKRGGGRGFESAIVVSPVLDEAVVVLANTETVDAEGIAMEALRELAIAEYPLEPSPVLDTLPQDAVRADADFDGKIRSIGWRVDKARVRAGSTVHVTLYFRALAPISRDYKIFVHAEADAAPRVRADHYPNAGRDSTAHWLPGRIVSDRFELRIPRDQPAGPLRLFFGFYSAAGRVHVLGGARDSRVRGPTLVVR